MLLHTVCGHALIVRFAARADFERFFSNRRQSLVFIAHVSEFALLQLSFA